jgi:GT2 family glycosyltransferase
MDLSVILVNWNAAALTAEALRSIRAYTVGITYELFVVDNGSRDSSEPAALEAEFPWAHVLRNPDNRGFSRANNQALRRARGRYLLLLNNDTRQVEDALGTAVRWMDGHPDVGALGITHLNDDAGKTPQHSFFAFPDPWLDVRSLVGLEDVALPTPEFDREQDVDWLVGSFLMIRRACYEDVGELDERFFVYDEDIDWCLRARQSGWRITYSPCAKLVHVGSASKPHLKDKTFMHYRSHLAYLSKHHGPAAAAYYLAMSARLAASTGKQVVRLLAGRASFEDVTTRLLRQRHFMTLGHGKAGVK